MANRIGITGRKSRNLLGAGLALTIAHVGAVGCGPEFDSCEDTHTCAPTGGSAGSSGGSDVSDSGSGSGATSGGKSSGGAAGSANVEGGASGSGGRGPSATGGTATGTGGEGDPVGVAGTGSGGEGMEEGGRSHGTGGAVGSGGTTTGGASATGGADATAGVGGEGGGGSPGTDCATGDTVLCSVLFGATSVGCSGRRVTCANGRWPETCIAGARDCTSAEDNDCDGKLDNSVDATCVCAEGDTMQCDPTPSNGGECESGIALCVVRAGNASSYWGTCKPKTETAPTYTLNRVLCRDNSLLGALCTRSTGVAGTLQSRCTTTPNTCGYLYCT
jgi:hypothetical protein